MSWSTVRVNRPQTTIRSELVRKSREIRAGREILYNLVAKDLKVRYKNSVLGFVWSMLNPLLYLGVFFVVFNVFLPTAIPDYSIYLLAGLLPWTFFTISLTHAAVSIVGNPDLVKKIYFPRELLALSPVGASLMHFFLQFAVLITLLLITGKAPEGVALLLVPLSLLAEVILIMGLALLFSALNVKARDAQHFLDLALLVLFWGTPIVYASALAAKQMGGYMLLGIPLLDLYLLNPMTRIVLAFQRGIYGAGSGDALIEQPVEWFLGGILYALVVGLTLIAFSWWIFQRLEASFAEEL